MKLADYLQQADLTPEQFAGKLGVDRSTVSRLTTGKRQPSWSLVKKIVEVTDGAVTANDFVHAEPASEAA